MGVALSSLVLLTGLVALPGCGDESKASKDSASDKKDKKAEKKSSKKDEKEEKDEGDAKPASAKPEEDKKAEPADAKAEGDAKDGDAEGEVDSGAPTCGALNEVPAIPDTDSKPPTVDEWKTACKVNTQGPNSHPDDCEMKVMREWLLVTCRGDYYKTQNMENFGSVGVDYFEMVKPNKLISYTMKLRKGRNQKVRMCHTKDKMASLFVSWPTGEEKPLHIALARAGKCD